MACFRTHFKVCAGVGLVAGLLAVGVALRAGQPASAPTTIALVGGVIHTQADTGTVKGTILVRDGKIVGLGPAVTLPADARQIDISGMSVTPGLIDARSSMWLHPAAVRESGSDGSLDVLDAIDPHEEDWKEVIRQGVTAVYVQPGSSGFLGGRGAVLRVRPAERVEDLVVKAGAGAQAALGTATPAAAPAAQQGQGRRFGGGPPVVEPAAPAEPTAGAGNSLVRFNQYEQLKRTLESFKRGDGEGKPAAGKGKGSTAPKRESTKAFLGKITKGEVPLRLEAHREDDIRNALRLAEELRLRLVLEGVSNAQSAAEVIVHKRIPLVLGPFLDVEESGTTRRSRASDWPLKLLAADSRWALGTFSGQPRGSRLLRAHAAAAIARGIDAEHVLRAVTRDAAEILGVGDRLGSLVLGRMADLVVFAGDPLDPAVPVRLVIGDGKIAYEDKTAVRTAPTPLARRTSVPARLPKRFVLRSQRFATEAGSLEAGQILVADGKVAAIGGGLAEGTPVIDLGDAVITPGLFCAHTQLGLGAAIDDAAEANAGQIRAGDVFDPQSRQARELLEAGFTTALLTPGSANLIGGSGVALRLGAAKPVLGDVGVKITLTGGSRGSGRPVTPASDGPLPGPQGRGGRGQNPGRYPASLAGQIELLEQTMLGKGPTTELYLPHRIGEQIQAERQRQMATVLERNQVALIEAHSRAEIDAALRLIDRFKLRAVLIGPDEFHPFYDEIKRLGVGIVARPVRADDYDRTTEQLAEAARSGIPIAFGSAPARDMRLAAAMAVNAGMSREAAWRGLTTAGSVLVGLTGNQGRLAVGGAADLVVWDGSPLDLRSRPRLVIVDGKLVAVSKVTSSQPEADPEPEPDPDGE